MKGQPRTDTPVAEALWGSTGLAGLQEFLLGPAAGQVLRQALGTLVEGGNLLGSCRLLRAKFKPGRRLSTYYDIDVRGTDGAGPTARSVAAAWRPTTNDESPSAQLPAVQAEAVERGLGAPFRRLHAEFPAWGLTVMVSPLDPEFPQLVRVSDPRHVQRMMETVHAANPGAPARTPAAQYAVTAVRYRPGQRHVLRYEALGAAGDQGTIFAKLYEDGEASARACRVATRVADWLAAHVRDLTAARPLGHVADDAVVLYPQLAGVPLSYYLRQPGQDAGRQLRQTGLMLRALHGASPAPPGRAGAHAALQDELMPHTLARESKAITRTCEHIRAFLPGVGARISRLLDQAQQVYEHLPHEPPAFAHGDFKADHLWVHGGGLTLMDFDTCYVADPAIDVGKFLSDLQWSAALDGRHTAANAQAEFLDAYAPGAPPDRLLRARVFEALVLVKTAAHRVPLFAPDWAGRTEHLIGRAEQALRQA